MMRRKLSFETPGFLGTIIKKFKKWKNETLTEMATAIKKRFIRANPLSFQKLLSSNDLTEAIVEGMLEAEEMNIEEHPFFRAFLQKYDTNLVGVDSVTSLAFLEDMKEFPSMPRTLPPQMLYPLGVHFNKKPLSTQRHFWIYLMLQCEQSTYQQFMSMHSEEVRERVSPVC